MYKFTFLADLHYYSKTLGTSGRAYELRSGSDQKCLAESGAIIDAAFDHLARSDTQAVLLAGDLTNDGEMVCHRELREKLYALAEKKPVYLITNTHDWCCDGNPRRFTGARVTHDVPTMPHTGIHDFYYDFGGRQAIAEYRTHLGISSYVIPLAEKIWLLALCDDQNGRGKAGYTEPHFRWIEEQLHRAKEQGCLVLGMQHHLLLPHVHPLLTGGCCVGDREAVTARLADAGLRYMFVGHSHLQRTDRYRSPAGNELTEMNIGALSGYPVPMVQVTVTDDLQVQMQVEHLATFDWYGRPVDAVAYTRDHACNLLRRLLSAGSPADFAQKLDALQLPGRKLLPLYPLVKPLFRLLRTGTVRDLQRTLRRLGLGRYVDARAAAELADRPILPYLEWILLQFMDGSAHPVGRDSAVYRLVLSVIEIPAHLLPGNMDMKKLIFACDAILTGGVGDHQQSVL